MRSIKRIISLLLACMLSASVLASCSNGGGDEAETSADTEKFGGVEILNPENPPVVMSFDSVENMTAQGFGLYKDEDARKSGYSTLITEGEMAPYLQLNYSVYGVLNPFRCMPMFLEADKLTLKHRFVRITYKTSDTGASEIRLCSGMDNEDYITVVENTIVSQGEWVTSPPKIITGSDILDRFIAGKYCMLEYLSKDEDTEFCIKEIAFFTSKDQAYAYYGDSAPERGQTTSLSVDGNPIGNYKIVISSEAPGKVREAANSVKDRIERISGVSIPVVDDNEPVGEYEILIGQSNRPASSSHLPTNKTSAYVVKLDQKNIIITSQIPNAIDAAADEFIRCCLLDGVEDLPDSFDISADTNINGSKATFTKFDEWAKVENVSSPEVISFDFSEDEYYFTEENGADVWHISDGALQTKAGDYSLSYVHVYEKNASVSAEITVNNVTASARVGLMLRYNSDDAFVRGGYDFAKKVWYIESREGYDFYLVRAAAESGELSEGKAYKLSLTVDGDTAVLTVDGKSVCEGKISHTSPGRIAVYAEGADVIVDNAEIALLSGQGTIIRGLVHNKLPGETYREGGTVWVMNDGSLTYQHHSRATFRSLDNGVTWQESDMWVEPFGYMNILRLANGEFMQMAKKEIDGTYYWISRTSSDEGKTWTDGGVICKTKWQGTAAGAGNMNDKIFQSPTTGRIFYSQNYEEQGVQVFCEYFYSDDNGKTWTMSETVSKELVGNEGNMWFGENKILECADGTLRMYASWHRLGCIVYSESTDNGVTWGPLKELEGFTCTQSSMQFVRDPYAENDTTYYMVWVYSEPLASSPSMPRSRLCLAKTTDGKNFTYLGDIWRWESNWRSNGSLLNHIVDPFVQVTEDYIICGSGFSEKAASGNDFAWHNGQRQHIYSIRKDLLVEKAELPPVK